MLIEATKLLTFACSPPAELLPWLIYEQSLTDKLKREVGEAKLSVLKQRWNSPIWWDRFILDLSPSQLVIHREILMCANDTTCWYARTIIPEHSYQANPGFFARLKQESLGSIIFNTAAVKRHQMFYYPVNSSSLEYHWCCDFLTERCDYLWARLSVFSLMKDDPFYLVEILLPGVIRIRC
ncbi:4-hydroxybenzoate synthetase [Legionella lansingensis]|uniref:4-hydroxybenzoate synthetase n=1 Tax=Legionella lansingensis TaxID=45067 RepID=A0A0W0VL29_9GAMM|nr:chorismate lyase [Legionella lansingensis]KTD20812.1 4-hydroxybenzoate synthetase [Legionella lansingensis]SNV49826.1 4-hydroxybenzoate synthetase [Legionella lansingensis]